MNIETIRQEETIQSSEKLIERVNTQVRPIARRAVRVWFNRGRLDEVLLDILPDFPDSQLVYAFDIGGRQMSSNILQDEIDTSTYWQDLSERPITIPLRTLSDSSSRDAFLCDAYVSQVTQQPCITAMYRVRSDSSLLGFIAVDFATDSIA